MNSHADLQPSQCRLCGNANLVFHFSCRGYSLYRCLSCSYVQIDRKPSQEEIRAIYDTCYFTSDKYKDEKIQGWENDKRLSLIKQFLPKKKSVILDAGCATGDFLQQAKKDYQVYGCDIAPFAVKLARSKNPDLVGRIFIVNLDAGDLNFAQFDAICLWDVIEHLWDPVTVCASFARLLKPGGFIFASTPDIGSITARLMGKRWAFMTPPEHMGFFSAASLLQLFGQSLPFTVLHRKATGKWTNLGFLFYKLKRVFPALVPGLLNNYLGKSAIGHVPVCVPTHDIQYIVASMTN